MALAYGSITYQMRRDMSELRVSVGELRDRYGFAYYREWGLILDGWFRTDGSGIDLARRGISNLESEGSFAHMTYWLSLDDDDNDAAIWRRAAQMASAHGSTALLRRCEHDLAERGARPFGMNDS